jgi:hypothetical protein
MTEETPTSWANYGKAECGETSKLKTCGACKLVKYCGKDCQNAPEHKNACTKRAAELYDEALFREPATATEEDCPLCFEIMLPTLKSGQTFKVCCGKTICTGCRHARKLHSNGRLTCPFCRARMPSAKEFIKLLEKRVDINDDANAMFMLGFEYFNGNEHYSVKKDINKGLKLLYCAAELGSPEACTLLGSIYHRPNSYNCDDAIKDKEKAKKYYEKGAIGGCAFSRFNLGCMEASDGSSDRAVRHWLIAASCGVIYAVNKIKEAMVMGLAMDDYYSQALRGYEKYLEAVRTDKRDEAAAYSDKYKYLFEA